MNKNRQTSILVGHPWFGSGGSEVTTAWAIAALQDEFDVTLVTAGEADLGRMESVCGAKINPERVSVIRAPRIPFVRSGSNLVALQQSYFQRFCRSLAGSFDLCISGYNFIPFGKPGIQLVGDFSFSEDLRKRFYRQPGKLLHRDTLIRKLYLQASRSLSGDPIPSPGGGDLILANSNWSAEQLKRYCGLSHCEVLYPPVQVSRPGSFRGDSSRNPLGFLYLGRISPEKEIEKIIRILEQVRESYQHDISFEIGGNQQRTAYEKHITGLVRRRPWIEDLGYCTGERKTAALQRNAFGIQACECEAFGIAAAEMASTGCLPFVPQNCGPAEIVPFRELHFGGVEEAVQQIGTLLFEEVRIRELRDRVRDQVARFGTEAFTARFQEFVEKALSREAGRKAGHPFVSREKRPGRILAGEGH